MDNDILIVAGSAVKAMGTDGNIGRLGGHLVLFGSPAERDNATEFFDAATDFRIQDGQKTPVYFHHGGSRKMAFKCLGFGTLSQPDTEGVPIYAELDLSDPDGLRTYEDACKGKLGWSSGTHPHLVQRESVKSGGIEAIRIRTWPLGMDASLTPKPCDPRNKAIPLKAWLDDNSLGDDDGISGDATDGDAVKADWSTAFKDTLPDSSFAYIEPGGHKDSEGKTVPRGLRHFPYKDADGKPDAAHVRNALARIPQSDVSAEAKAEATKKVQAAAKTLGIGEAAAGDKKDKNADSRKSVDPDTLPDMLEALASGHVGLKLRDHSQAVLDAAKGLVRRVEDKAEKRAFSPAALKSGRVMSGENYAFHDATCSALESIVAQYRTHLDKHKPGMAQDMAPNQMDGKMVAGVVTHPAYPAAVAYGGAGKSSDFDAAKFDAELEDLEIAAMQQALRHAALRQVPIQTPLKQALATASTATASTAEALPAPN